MGFLKKLGKVAEVAVRGPFNYMIGHALHKETLETLYKQFKLEELLKKDAKAIKHSDIFAATNAILYIAYSPDAVRSREMGNTMNF